MVRIIIVQKESTVNKFIEKHSPANKVSVVFGTKATAFMMNVIWIIHDQWAHTLAPVGCVLGCYLDRKMKS